MVKGMFSVIIVTYNSATYIRPCLNSIFCKSGSTAIEIIVVDNASTDQTVEIIKIEFPKVRVALRRENGGFSVACNQGANLAKGEFLYFCNPDTVILDDIFSCANHWLSDRSIGVFSPLIMAPNGYEHAFAFNFPHPPTLLIGAFVRNAIGKSNAERLQICRRNKAMVIECDWVLGACLFISSATFRDIGGFDEAFFLYFEDVDICKRVKQAGHRVIASREAAIMHHKYGSSRLLHNLEVRRIRLQSELTYYLKHHQSIGLVLASLLDKKSSLFRS